MSQHDRSGGEALDAPAEPVNVSEFEGLAERTMPRGAFDYYAGGAEDEQTLRANRAAFQEIFLRPRMLTGAAEIDTSVQVLGIPLRTPLLIAPTAFQKLAHPEGEAAKRGNRPQPWRNRSGSRTWKDERRNPNESPERQRNHPEKEEIGPCGTREAA